MAAEFIYNARGGKMLAENGYIYEKQKKRKFGGSQVPLYIRKFYYEYYNYTSIIILLQMWLCVRYHNLRCGHHVLTPTDDDPVGQGCPTRGPRAKFGPLGKFIWPSAISTFAV